MMKDQRATARVFRARANKIIILGVNRMFLIGTKHRSQTSVVMNRPATPCCHLQCVPRGQKIALSLYINV